MMVAGVTPPPPAEVWIFILFFIDDNRTRGALRAVSRHVQGAGEAARIAVEAACARVGDPRDPIFNEYVARASWWTPWKGINRIYSPAQMHGPARDRWNRLTAYYRHRRGVTVHYRDYIEVHMNSSSSINHRSWHGGSSQCWSLIYTGAV